MEIVLRSQDFPHKTAKDVCVCGEGGHVTVELKFPQVISSLPILLLKFPEADFSSTLIRLKQLTLR